MSALPTMRPFALLFATFGCTLALNREGTQCQVDADCRRFSSAATCVSGACVPVHTSPPKAEGPAGCFAGTPSTDLEFFNRCTSSDYVVFDNCERLGLCKGEYDPAALIAPPARTMGSTQNTPVTLPDVGCYDPETRPKLLFMQGSTNFTPFIRAMAPLVAKNGYTIVWQPTSSCAGVGAGGFDPTSGANWMRNPTSTAQSLAAYYDSEGRAFSCALGNSPNAPAPGAEITDIGQSDVFAASCGSNANWVPGSEQFPNVGHYLGPIQAMVFVTPPASKQRVISAEAAHMVFGMGGNQQRSKPWIDPEFMWIRSPSTGTNNILSRGIDVPATKWWGIDKKTGPAMHDAILTVSAADAEKTIGTLSIDYANNSKNSLHILHFQSKGQLAGFLPDSSSAAEDKKNVRDGHYSLWGPIHLYTPILAGQPSPAATAFILPFSNPNAELIDATVAGGYVPPCAMEVARDTEMGPLRSFSPDFQCHCYYESKVSGGTDCRPCEGPADCPASLPACNLGFCELR